MTKKVNSEVFMRRCFELAQRGLGHVNPNPLVGCVIVQNDTIMAEGFHQRFGGPHAEVEALHAFDIQKHHPAATLTMFVNLEPCDHFGKTPPCTNAIIESGIQNVIVSNIDPNPLVAGKGISRLKDAGINVKHGLLKDEGLFLNRRFMTFHSKKRPYVILKWAQSTDGFMAPENSNRIGKREPFWISSELSRKLVHKWRAEEQAILVGRNTVQVDDPKLTCRIPEGRDPIRVIIDPNLTLDFRHQVFAKNGRVILLNKNKNIKKGNLELIKFNPDETGSILSELYKSDIQSVIVEGGRKTLDQFILSGLWDEARVFTGSSAMKNGLPSPVLNLSPSQIETIGTDQLETYFNL